MKKTVIILGAALITLSATLAFRTKSEITPVAKQEKVASNKGEGFALQDSDQWK